MMRPLWIVPAIVIAASVYGPSQSLAEGPQGKRLTGAELRALLGGGANVEYESPRNGGKGTKAYKSDGTLEWRGKNLLSGFEYTDTGTWYVEGDIWCEKAKTYPEAGGCHRYFQVGENSFEKWDSQGLVSRVRILK